MDKLERFIATLDGSLNTDRRRHITGGVLLSISLLFGSLALTVMTLKRNEEKRMNQNNIFMFGLGMICGAVISGAITYKITKEKDIFEKEIEINEVREFYKEKKLLEKTDNVDEELTEEQEVDPITLYSSSLTEKEVIIPSKPYTIDAEEFSITDYDISELTYYIHEDVLSNEYDEIIENKEAFVGNALDLFKNDEDLVVIYVRDDNKKIDYEILRDNGPVFEGVQND